MLNDLAVWLSSNDENVMLILLTIGIIGMVLDYEFRGRK